MRKESKRATHRWRWSRTTSDVDVEGVGPSLPTHVRCSSSEKEKARAAEHARIVPHRREATRVWRCASKLEAHSWPWRGPTGARIAWFFGPATADLVAITTKRDLATLRHNSGYARSIRLRACANAAPLPLAMSGDTDPSPRNMDTMVVSGPPPPATLQPAAPTPILFFGKPYIHHAIGNSAVNSVVTHLPISRDTVLPDNTTFAHKSLRMSSLYSMMLWQDVSCTPMASLPMKLGWNETCAQRNRLALTAMRILLTTPLATRLATLLLSVLATGS